MQENVHIHRYDTIHVDYNYTYMYMYILHSLLDPEWEEMRSNGVSKGVLTVTIQNVNTENDSIKKIGM